MVSQGALFKHRTCRSSSAGVNGKQARSTSRLLPTESRVSTESRIATHIIALYKTLLVVGINELNEALQEDDLAQRITATFRRTLPALRISSKWLRANLTYVLRSREPSTRHSLEDITQRVGRGSRGDSSPTIEGLPQFWATYAQFVNALLSKFPADKLPLLDVPLEEDIETESFLPLKLSPSDAKRQGSEGAPVEESITAQIQTLGDGTHAQAHPNEEQLMRIGDLLTDAQALADVQV